MKQLQLISVAICLLAVAAACGSDTTANGSSDEGQGTCTETYSTKEEVQARIQELDTTPLAQATIDAFEAGCAASKTDAAEFMEAFLCSIEASASFASDADVQNDVDNLECIDIDNLQHSCDTEVANNCPTS